MFGNHIPERKRDCQRPERGHPGFQQYLVVEVESPYPPDDETSPDTNRGHFRCGNPFAPVHLTHPSWGEEMDKDPQMTSHWGYEIPIGIPHPDPLVGKVDSDSTSLMSDSDIFITSSSILSMGSGVDSSKAIATIE